MDSIDAKNAVVTVVAIVLGFVGLVFVFSDPGPGEGWLFRVSITMAFYFLSGVGIGYMHPGGWLIAMLIAWGGVMMGGFIVLMAVARYGREAFNASEPPFVASGLIMLIGSLGLTFLGGFLGKSLPRRNPRIRSS
ncbi:MAG: hypothetical protein IT173_05895 [Acidobacteria bacterium]|nr:hypothetical protein [Acidobacteriota bacterium]